MDDEGVYDWNNWGHGYYDIIIMEILKITQVMF